MIDHIFDDFVLKDVVCWMMEPESENKETGDNKEVEANTDKDEEPEDDPKLVGDGQQEDGDQAMEDLGREGGI